MVANKKAHPHNKMIHAKWRYLKKTTVAYYMYYTCMHSGYVYKKNMASIVQVVSCCHKQYKTQYVFSWAYMCACHCKTHST